ncbi:hypothetical protein HPP92_024348 [Vanilla planifolia]|uniref:EF-hand domain-containing protein n=1 Tax=Vanilla planifolia TaxID=51239 RepID=A0A835PMR4_VANPL|nr:hypothetical protein HPP92_024348 [Vanilla planifolia]
MTEIGLTVLDGTELRSGDLRLPIASGPVTGAKLVEWADAEASARLFDVPLPDCLRSAALRRVTVGDDGFMSLQFNDADSQKKKIQEYLVAVADELQDNPLVVSILDGSALRLILDDEDDFAMVAENLFTDLDINDTGKVRKSEMPNVLAHMGVELGVPPFSIAGDLLSNILERHGAEGEEQLGQAQFAQLLQSILLDLADALAAKRIVVVQNIKVLNGSKLRKGLDDRQQFDAVVSRMFKEWGEMGNGKKEELRDYLQRTGPDLGLPPIKSNEATCFYDQIFSAIPEEKISGDFSIELFREVVKEILEKCLKLLETNPVFVDAEE